MNRQELQEIQKRWAPPAELRQPPRDVQLNAGGRVLAGLAVLMLAGGVVGGALLAGKARLQAANHRALQTEGRETDARVMRLWQKRDDNKRLHMVEYRFEHEGRSYRREVSLPVSQWSNLKVDDPIRVTFVPSDPSVSQVYNRPGRSMPLWVPVIVAGMGLGVAVPIAFSLARSKALLAEGRVAPGVVTKLQKVHTGEGGSIRLAHYEYRLMSGAIARGRSHYDRKGMTPGGVVCVIYDPNHAGRSAIYPFQLVKVRRDT